MIKITKAEARRLILTQQGLDRKAPFGKGKTGILETLRRLGYVQIDTISVIQRAQHHTFWLRVPNYEKDMLMDLQAKERTIFEYWSHAAAYLPTEDYRFCLPRMKRVREKDDHWRARNPKVMEKVLERIREEGPLRSRDFKPPKDHKSGPWWDWKPAKEALEQLFHEGDLMICRRENFQKVYDLRERVLPDGVDSSVPTMEEYLRYLALSTIKAQGLAQEQEMRYLRKKGKKDLAKTLKELVEEGEIIALEVEGLSGNYYTIPAFLDCLSKRKKPRILQFLNPFDNAIIQRQRVRDFFDFDYKLEIYVTEKKRIYGYYSLAVLWGDRFVGHLDTKADRKTGTFLLKAFTPVEGFVADEAFYAAFDKRIGELAAFNDCAQLSAETSRFLKK